MSYENKLDRLIIHEESQAITQKQVLETSRAGKFSPLMVVMRFEEHDASQVDKWLMMDLEGDFDATYGMKAPSIH
jgi:hypothetical protein